MQNRSQEANERTASILRAARHLIARGGMHSLRVQDVAAEVGVSSALVYYYFGTRGRLLIEAFKHADVESASRESIAATGTTSVVDKVTQALLEELRDTPEIRDDSIVWSEAAASAVFDDDLREVVVSRALSWIETIAGTIAEGQAAGEVPAAVDPATAAVSLTAITESLNIRFLLGITSRESAVELLTRSVATTLA